MRRLIAILLLCVLSHQLLLKLGIVAWYEWNKDYVAKNLCENRDKPQLKCCGKCYLRKQLKNANGTETPLSVKLTKGKVSPFILPAVWAVTAQQFANGRPLVAYSMPVAEDVSLGVIQPPG